MIPEWFNTLNEDEKIKSRKYPEYYDWIKNVKNRDDFTCEICKYKGEDIVAHHLDGYSWCKERRTDIDNGVTLCKSCHDEFHSMYGFKNNTESQYLEFYFLKVIRKRGIKD